MPTSRAEPRDVVTEVDSAAPGAYVARVVSCAPGGQPEVDVPGRGVQRARVLRSVDRAWLASDAARGCEVLVVFAGGERAEPVITGVLEDPIEALIAGASPAASEAPAARAADAARPGLQGERGEIELRIDGRTVTLDARDEVTLRCGEASVSLYADGRIVTRGVNIVSQASEQQRIQGAVVKIN